MNYIESYRKKIRDTPRGSAYKTYETPSDAGFVGFIGTSQGHIPDFSPPVDGDDASTQNALPLWPPRPAELAGWPIPWRRRWGELSNEFEGRGVQFPESERRAFDLVKAEMEAP